MAARLLLLTALVMGVTATSDYTYALPGTAYWPRQYHWSLLRSTVEGDVVVRGDAAYNMTALYTEKNINQRNNYPQPAAVAYPKNTRDVQKLMFFARLTHMRVAVWSTGHNTDLRSTADNALMINMQHFNDLSVDVAGETATVGPANVFSDLIDAVKIASNGTLVPVTGNILSVGMWGWSVGGGIGMLTKMYGLGADAIVSATVVTAKGKVVTATADNEHKDLLWALKGGAGSSFGVGISLTVRLYPDPGVFHGFKGVYAVSDTIADEFSAHVEQLGNNAGGFYFLVGDLGFGQIAWVIGYCIGDDCDCEMAGFEDLPGCMPIPGLGDCARYTQPDLKGWLDNFISGGFSGKYQWVMGGTEGAPAEQFKMMNAWMAKPEEVPFQKQCYANAVVGGASIDLDTNNEKTAIAPGFRQALQYVTCMGIWDDSLSVEDQRKVLDILYEFERTTLAPFSPQEWVYWNEAQHEFEGDSWHTRYWGSEANYQKLLSVKLEYDATNFLTCYHCVGWDFAETVDPSICPSNDCSCTNNPAGTCAEYETGC